MVKASDLNELQSYADVLLCVEVSVPHTGYLALLNHVNAFLSGNSEFFIQILHKESNVVQSPSLTPEKICMDCLALDDLNEFKLHLAEIGQTNSDLPPLLLRFEDYKVNTELFLEILSNSIKVVGNNPYLIYFQVAKFG